MKITSFFASLLTISVFLLNHGGNNGVVAASGGTLRDGGIKKNKNDFNKINKERTLGGDPVLTGTWHMEAVIPVVGGDRTLHAMVTYMSDGTLVHTSGVKATINENAHGVWEKRGDTLFVEQNRLYQYHPNGDLKGWAETTEIIMIDEEDDNTYTGEATTTIYDTNGVQLPFPEGGPVEYTIMGIRMTLTA